MKLYLIDGSGYLYREFYGIRTLNTSTGLPTNAVFGVAKKLLALIKQEHPDHICVCFDAPGPTFRKEMFEEYKANRPPAPADLVPQFPLVRELIAAMGIPMWEKCGYEADDLLGTLAHEGMARGDEVIIYSGDKDLAQLVAPGVILRDPYNADHELLPGQLIEKMGVMPEQVIDYLALMGDSSDNIPGVPKIGAKTAAKLLSEYGTLDKILANAANIKPPSIQKTLLENGHLAYLSKDLATIKCDVPEAPSFDQLSFSGLNKETIYPFLVRLEMHDLAKKIGAPMNNHSSVEGSLPGKNKSSGAISFAEFLEQKRSEQSAKEEQKTTAADPILTPEQKLSVDSSLVITANDWDNLEKELQGAQEILVEPFCSRSGFEGHLIGLGLLVANHGFYIPLDHHYLGALEHLDKSLAFQKLRPHLESRLAVLGHDVKSLNLALLKTAGFQIKNLLGDSMLAAYLLEPERPSLCLSDLAIIKGCSPCQEEEQLLGRGRQKRFADDLTENEVQIFIQQRLIAVRELHSILAGELEKNGLTKLYRETELPLVPVLAKMEASGIKIDAQALRIFGQQLDGQIGQILAKVKTVVGPDLDLNIASPQQLANYLYERCQLTAVDVKGKQLKGTDQEALESLVGLHPLPQLVLDYRQLSKLQGTYVEALLKVLDNQSRVHTYFDQARTATGRLASRDPNLQNIPSRTDLGRNIRQTFVAADGYSLLAADYSQIELRMLAHFSQDPAFIAAYKEGEDIHDRTAREIFGTTSAELRRQAKTINFGIIYGLSSFSLAKSLGISNGAAREYMDNYFGRYPGIKSFMSRTIEEAKINGYVTTLFGRKRNLPALQSGKGNERRQAERMAVNTVVQGSAADLIKVAMIRLDQALTAGNYKSRLLLQVHDELILEVHDSERLAVLEETVSAMEEAVKLLVPLKVEAHFGINWADAH